MGNTRKEKLKILFATHPQADELHMDSNDRAYFKKTDAESAQQMIDPKKKVESYKRSEFEVDAIENLDKDIAAQKAKEEAEAKANADAEAAEAKAKEEAEAKANADAEAAEAKAKEEAEAKAKASGNKSNPKNTK